MIKIKSTAARKSTIEGDRELLNKSDLNVAQKRKTFIDYNIEPIEKIDLDNFDEYNPLKRINSPISLDVCKKEGINLNNLYYKSKAELLCHFYKGNIDTKLREREVYSNNKFNEIENYRKNIIDQLRKIRNEIKFNKSKKKNQRTDLNEQKEFSKQDEFLERGKRNYAHEFNALIGHLHNDISKQKSKNQCLVDYIYNCRGYRDKTNSTRISGLNLKKIDLSNIKLSYRSISILIQNLIKLIQKT